MSDASQYLIRGGLEGRERLRLLARVLQRTTAALLERAGVRAGMRCLDAGCGGGDVTLELARRTAPGGSAVGIDMDATKIEIAQREAAAAGVANVEFTVATIDDSSFDGEFDVVYARFLLTHRCDPAATVQQFVRWLRPGGVMVAEDIDYSGYFVYPRSEAFDRYHALYCDMARMKGCDPNIGPRLPLLLRRAGLLDIGVSVAQPLGIDGEVKLINAVTMENLAGSLISLGLTTHGEVDRLLRELYDIAADPETVAGMPRVVQTWGRKAA